MIEPKTPGRKKREFPTKSVHVRLEPEMYEYLKDVAIHMGYYKNKKPNVSRAVREIIKEKCN